MFGWVPSVSADGAKEYDLKSAFIYQFTNFIDWPSSKALGLYQKNFVISVVGESPLIEALEEVSLKRKIKGRVVKIMTHQNFESLKNTDMVVIVSGDESILGRISSMTSGFGVLIISQSSGFIEKGSMINFYKDDGRIRFEINLKNAKREKIQISSRLLNLSRVVE